jgi:glycosyltransferase involved in cell wall biosynthesis
VNGTRVLRIYHSAVVAEYRAREHLLRSRHGYDVHLVSPARWPEGGSMVEAADDLDVPLHIVGTRGRRHPILFWYAHAALRRVLREVRPHIVDIHEEPYSLAAAAALSAVATEVPTARICIYTAQNILKRYPAPFRALESRALRLAAAAYPCSTEAGYVLRSKGFAGSVHVLPLGVSLRSTFPRAQNTGRLRVGFVGRLEAYKGGELAIRAFAEAAIGVDAVLEIVGAGPQRSELEEWAARLEVTSRVMFAGAVSQEEALRRIASYDVLLVPSVTTPSWKEQFGRVPAQALEAGTPVIASDSGSLRQVLGGCGVLVREGDIADLTEKLGALLRDPVRRQELSDRGRQHAVEAFSWEAVVDGCDSMYREALGRT